MDKRIKKLKTKQQNAQGKREVLDINNGYDPKTQRQKRIKKKTKLTKRMKQRKKIILKTNEERIGKTKILHEIRKSKRHEIKKRREEESTKYKKKKRMKNSSSILRIEKLRKQTEHCKHFTTK